MSDTAPSAPAESTPEVTEVDPTAEPVQTPADAPTPDSAPSPEAEPATEPSPTEPTPAPEPSAPALVQTPEDEVPADPEVPPTTDLPPVGDATVNDAVVQGNRVAVPGQLVQDHPISILQSKIAAHFNAATNLVADFKALLASLEDELNKLRVGF